MLTKCLNCHKNLVKISCYDKIENRRQVGDSDVLYIMEGDIYMLNKMKKLISICLVVTMATVIYSPIIANAETLTVNKSSSSFDLSTVDITMEEYNLLTFEERQELFDELYNLVFPSNNNARYKSSEDDPTHQAITSQAADAFINDKGFYSSDSSASIALLLTLVVYSGVPDSTSDESYKFSNKHIGRHSDFPSFLFFLKIGITRGEDKE